MLFIKLLPEICEEFPRVCDLGWEVIMGPSSNLNDSRLDYYLEYEPNPSSMKNVIHGSQGTASRSFQKFDYGFYGNMKMYNQPTPPQYELQYYPKEVPLALFTGSQDEAADPLDVQELIKQLPMKPFHHNEPSYAHVDFLWAPNAHQLIYPTIISLIENVTTN